MNTRARARVCVCVSARARRMGALAVCLGALPLRRVPAGERASLFRRALGGGAGRETSIFVPRFCFGPAHPSSVFCGCPVSCGRPLQEAVWRAGGV